ncbi:MAG TPA: phosphatidate cytidylyltransferase [Chitinophagaceae bacterium]|nr:phosphatidate cytidylyltransferase [Chitinophagaceae bacterium]
MALNVQTFLTRLGSAALFSAMMLGCMLWHEAAFVLLFALICFLCLREFIPIVEKIVGIRFHGKEKFSFMGLGMALYLFTISLPIQTCPNILAQLLSEWMLFYGLGMGVGFLIFFFSGKRTPGSVVLLSGLGYIPLALGLLVQMRFQSLLLPLILVLFIWMNDTMAYLSGSFVGKTPFFPTISPKKTVEGTIGGILFTMAFAAIWGYFVHWFPMWHWVGLALIASLLGTLGDLAESKLKRMAGIKDSGQIMPGHGGALDRFDSLLLAAPVAFLFALFFIQCYPYRVF